MEKLIERLKQIRKRSYIKKAYTSKYAFVGMGNHSINNLYPIINYLRLELKYIVTHSEKNANLINDNFPAINGTADFNKVLNDNEIGGIFICATPKSHFHLVKKSLSANKNVFVEKPPCITLKELHELVEIEKKSKGRCFVGLQKQYAPFNVELQKHAGKKCTYNYRYVTGAYPEGDAYLDLFIHPLALSLFLFRKAELKSVVKNKSKSGTTDFLTLQHLNGTTGIIELSTDYSWKTAAERMIINTEKGIFEMNDSENLTFTQKQGLLFGLPEEKIFKDKRTVVTLKKRNNFAPVFENNQLYTSGYYSEIENFVKFCEQKKYTNNSSLEDCLDVFEFIEKLKKCTE